MPVILGQGVTRTVFRVGRWAVKVPGGMGCYVPEEGRLVRLWARRPQRVLRGWLANRSEWKQRWRLNANVPDWTVGYVVQGYRVAEELARDGLPEWEELVPHLERLGFTSAEEVKPSSWGKFDGFWLLLDFDRAWEHPRGWVGGLYWWNQERLGRKWSKLPGRGLVSDPDDLSGG